MEVNTLPGETSIYKVWPLKEMSMGEQWKSHLDHCDHVDHATNDFISYTWVNTIICWLQKKWKEHDNSSAFSTVATIDNSFNT